MSHLAFSKALLLIKDELGYRTRQQASNRVWDSVLERVDWQVYLGTDSLLSQVIQASLGER